MEQLTQRIDAWLWPETPPAAALERALRVIGRYAFALTRELASGELKLRAMSLVYTTILAVVPLLALTFSVLKGFGFHRRMEPLLLSFLMPLGPRAEELTANIIGFVDNISGSTLAGVGLGLLLYSALSMAQKFEDSFNFVWRVDRPRSFGRRFSEYLSVLLVGPMIMMIAMGMTATVTSTALVERLQGIEPLGSLIVMLTQSMPYLLIIGAFTFLYAFIPNTSVRLRSALLGGLIAGGSWAVIGKLFAQFVAGAGRTEAIYAGFAIVIVAMLWLYVSWLILLLGAQFTFYHQNPEHLRFGRRTPTVSNQLRERLAMSIMLLVATDFDRPGHGWRVPSLAAKIGVQRHYIQPIVEALMDAELLTETTELRLVPSRALRRIDLTEILDAVRGSRADARGAPTVSWGMTIDSLCRGIDTSIANVLADKSLADLVSEDEAREDAQAQQADVSA
ncbi:MAG: YihY/virulence factor BrkB family protein [Gammaproteobacteria bacterium]|nr:YihY/virulence factor BrkB family protein [Gammaproteobacteria bacterium]MDH3505620.1 YihY/virulence factor BrkB family protein [Gammaproteobacteria bacterium]